MNVSGRTGRAGRVVPERPVSLLDRVVPGCRKVVADHRVVPGCRGALVGLVPGCLRMLRRLGVPVGRARITPSALAGPAGLGLVSQMLEGPVVAKDTRDRVGSARPTGLVDVAGPMESAFPGHLDPAALAGL